MSVDWKDLEPAVRILWGRGSTERAGECTGPKAGISWERGLKALKDQNAWSLVKDWG